MHTSRYGLLTLVGATLAVAVAFTAHAHPGCGIEVDEHGNVYFIDTGHGIWHVDPHGTLTSVGGPAFHFLAVDSHNRFRQAHFAHRTPGDVTVVGHDPTFLAGSSYPLAVGADGACYYPEVIGIGRVRIMRLAAGEAPQPFAELPMAREVGPDGQPRNAEWIWALAAGKDGALVYTEQRAVRRIAADGKVTLLAGDVHVPHCQHPPGVKDDHADPALYGLAVADDGTVYVAAMTCGAVLKITADGEVSVALRATDGWMPTGVAVAGPDLYVLEYTGTERERREDWLPRVRKLAADGTVSLVAEVKSRSETGRSHGFSSGRSLPPLDQYFTPPMAHAAVIHFPIVLSFAGSVAALMPLLVPHRNAWRIISAALLALTTAACYLAESTGNRAELEIPYGENGVPPAVWEHLREHTGAAGRLSTATRCGAVAALVALIPTRHAVPGLVRYVASGLACAAAIAASVFALQTAHQGGSLVYQHGIGTEPLYHALATRAAVRGRSADPFAGARAGEQRQVAGVQLCWCPAGTFIMGSPPTEPERRPGEDPVQVTLTRGFWMGKFEVTQGDWKRVAGNLPGEFTAELPAGDNLPVGNVNFAEAEAFCAKLTEQAHAAGELPSNWEFRLPTEAQWEYACRAGTTTATSFGDSITSEQANFDGTRPFNGAAVGPFLHRAADVGSYPANPWGLHDLHGNTCEWCRDWFHLRLPGGADPDLHDAQSTATPNDTGDRSRSRRGGTWADPGWPQRSAFRQRFEPERRYDHIGFRVVVERR